ncbi:MAG: 3-deoxy-8-phosphooctulonate synthase [Verrucomicrobiae bacterium]|nr:3-deoxy-8-phosphooctulonate synthase [Verrucomicrobiae bacterium]
MKTVTVGKIKIGNGHPLVLIAGPCVIEGEKWTLSFAVRLADMARTLKVPFIFKASYDKANRSSIHSYRGVGLREGGRILARIRAETGAPVLTDVHSPEEASEAAESVDILQIPAFLCRQTDLLVAAAKTGRVVNVKKGQFLAPHDMVQVVKKIESVGHTRLMLVERGTTFGYNNLVTDMRGIAVMKQTGYPVIMDATHAVQLPGAGGDKSSGQAEMAPVLARAAVAAGADGVFVETHENPAKALSDGPNMVRFRELPALVRCLKKIHAICS